MREEKMKQSSTEFDVDDEYDNPDWADISTANVSYEWTDQGNLDGLATPTQADATVIDTELTNHAFQDAEQIFLRGAPVPVPGPSGAHRRNGRYTAWVVFRGHNTGVFLTWPGASAQLTGFSGCCVKGYHSIKEARDAWEHACASQDVVSANQMLNPISLNSSTLHDAPSTPSPSPSRSSSCSSSRSSSPSSSEDDSDSANPFIKQYVFAVSPTYSPLQLRHRNALDLVAQKFAEAIAAGVEPPPIASVYASGRIRTPQHTRNANAGPPVASSSTLTPAGPLSDEEIWWVVLRGDFPGVYHGKTVAQSNAGTSGQVWVKKAGSHDQARHIFNAALANGDVLPYF